MTPAQEFLFGLVRTLDWSTDELANHVAILRRCGGDVPACNVTEELRGMERGGMVFQEDGKWVAVKPKQPPKQATMF